MCGFLPHGNPNRQARIEGGTQVTEEAAGHRQETEKRGEDKGVRDETEAKRQQRGHQKAAEVWGSNFRRTVTSGMLREAGAQKSINTGRQSGSMGSARWLRVLKS